MKTLKNIIITGIALICLTGCFDDPGTDIVLDRDNFVTIADASESGTVDRRIVVIQDGQSSTQTIDVEIVGPAINSDVTVQLDVVPEESTAIEGVDFDFTSGKSVTIPANSFRASLSLDVYDDNLDPSQPLKLTLAITDSSIPTIEEYAEFTMQLIGICPPADYDYASMEGTYKATSDGSSTDSCPTDNPTSGFVYDGIELALDPSKPETEDNIYFVISEAFGGLYIDWYADCYGYDFETPAQMSIDKNTGDITIAASSGFDGDNFTITGAVDPCNGNFTLTWVNVYGDAGTSFHIKNE